MNLEKVLQNFGLNEKEALIYLTLLELREALPSTIARKSGIKRPTTYVILGQLQKKGLATHVKRSNNLYFQATNPEYLLSEQVDRTEAIKKALPELMAMHTHYGVMPQVTVFENGNGLIQIMEDTLTTKTDLLCWCDVNIAMGTILKEYFPTYLEKKIAKKIWLKGIFTYNKGGLRHKKFQDQELREVHLIPSSKFPMKNEINIYDDKVAIISHQDEVGVIIQNQNIADTQKSIFNLAFEYAQILEKQLLTKEDLRYLADKSILNQILVPGEGIEPS